MSLNQELNALPLRPEFSNLNAMLKYTLIFVTVFALACGNSAVNNDSTRAGAGVDENRSQASAHSNHKSVDHHSAAGHSEMKSSPGAESAPLELQFIDTMIAHHKGAVEMAMLAETRAASGEVKELATNIINDQEREIAKMSEWRDQWFAEKPEAINMSFPGMALGMRGMDMQSLASKTGRDFDLEFLRQMIPHHEGAVEMAKTIHGRDSRKELKELADDIIAAQEAEIRQMRDWLSKWESR